MKGSISLSLFALLIFAATVLGQGPTKPLPNSPSSQAAANGSGGVSDNDQRVVDPPSPSVAIDSKPQRAQANAAQMGLGAKFCDYINETYFNVGALTAPAFRAGLRMANPPGKGVTQYPPEWRQGAEAFGRNYGDAFVQRVTFQTARFATGVITHEAPRYIPSSSRNVLARSLHALTFTF